MNQEQDTSAVATNEKIAKLMKSYRKLKAEITLIQKDMDEIKSNIEPLVKVIGGKWDDDLGYARQNTRSASVSYKSADVDKVVRTWLKSQESLIRTCGQMMEVHRTRREGTTYLQIK